MVRVSNYSGERAIMAVRVSNYYGESNYGSESEQLLWCVCVISVVKVSMI